MSTTINEGVRRNDRVIAGSAVLVYDFPILEEGDIKVLQEGVLLVPPQYAVTGVGNSSGGTVIVATAPADGTRFTLLGRQPIKQTSIYTVEAFPPTRIQDDFNRRTVIDQQHAEVLGRTLRAPEAENLDMTIHPIVQRASRLQGYDANGLPALYVPVDAAVDFAPLVQSLAGLGGMGLSNNVLDAFDLDIAPGARWSDDTAVADRVMIVLPNTLTKQIDAAWAVGNNAGMLATGAALQSVTHHIFVILRLDTGVVDIAADTSAVGANIVANTNAAYTKKRRIGSLLVSPVALVGIEPFVQDRAVFRYKQYQTPSEVSNPGTAAITFAVGLPAGIRVQAILVLGISSVDAQTFALVSDLSQADQNPAAAGFAQTVANTGGAGTAEIYVFTDTAAQMRLRVSFSNANVLVRVFPTGWVDEDSQR